MLWHEVFTFIFLSVIKAEDQLKEPVRRTIKSLQSKGYLRLDMDSEWMLNVLYSLLFTTWQQVQEGTIAKKSAATLIIETLFNGIKA
ncbi:hypothetical protein [Lysinibacillus sp. G01H]|uniref:hypothetical protein n=1 Tax=Lysinibacillus sp. G01H TaxID=3026425 RepID=UPI00237DF9D5|nr:hypothetical protein [Lysinibacillus sp. G01H]WDU78128.1 hypothetical protein PSR12_15710 [Lysinibacillus sp. G01H]